MSMSTPTKALISQALNAAAGKKRSNKAEFRISARKSTVGECKVVSRIIFHDDAAEVTAECVPLFPRSTGFSTPTELGTPAFPSSAYAPAKGAQTESRVTDDIVPTSLSAAMVFDDEDMREAQPLVVPATPLNQVTRAVNLLHRLKLRNRMDRAKAEAAGTVRTLFDSQ